MKKIVFALLCLPFAWAVAETTPDAQSLKMAAGLATDCGTLTHIQSVVHCALKNHTRVIELQSNEQVSSLKQGAAAYRPNPRVEVQGGLGQDVGNLLTQFQISLAQPVEVGGKRSSRIALADAELNQSRVAKEVGTLEVLIEIYGRIFKIHELFIHQKSTQESLQFVDRVYKLYKSRPHLDPEQQASKHLFEMIKQKYSFDLILLARDMESELNEIVLMTQNKISKNNLKELIINLPEPQWPDLKSEYSGKSLWVKQLSAEALVKEKNYDFEVAQSFPDFEIGPYYQQEYQGPLLTQFLGVAVSFPFPIFNINSGGRALAKAEMQSALLRKQITEAKEQLEMKFLIDSYQSMTTELKKLPALRKGLEKTNPAKGLFERGLIPATLAIENQRTHQELIMTAHDLEIKTLEILFKIRSIEGVTNPEQLTLWPNK